LTLCDTTDIHTCIVNEDIPLMKSSVNFAACSPHFSFTALYAQTKYSRYELQQEIDSEYTQFDPINVKLI
jgi:hypothetical protein